MSIVPERDINVMVSLVPGSMGTMNQLGHLHFKYYFDKEKSNSDRLIKLVLYTLLPGRKQLALGNLVTRNLTVRTKNSIFYIIFNRPWAIPYLVFPRVTELNVNAITLTFIKSLRHNATGCYS